MAKKAKALRWPKTDISNCTAHTAKLNALPHVFCHLDMVTLQSDDKSPLANMMFLHGSNTMRIAIFALAIMAGSGAAEAGQIEVISASPRHIEIAAWCWTAGSNCQQEASDVAQGYCYGPDYPRRAIYVRSGLVERGFFSERVIFVYRCNRRSIICEAGSCN